MAKKKIADKIYVQSKIINKARGRYFIFIKGISVKADEWKPYTFHLRNS